MKPSAARQARTACATCVPQAMPRSPRLPAVSAVVAERRQRSRVALTQLCRPSGKQAHQRRVRGSDDRCAPRRSVRGEALAVAVDVLDEDRRVAALDPVVGIEDGRVNDGAEALARRIRRVRRNERVDEDLIPFQNLVRVLLPTPAKPSPGAGLAMAVLRRIGSRPGECAAVRRRLMTPSSGDHQDRCQLWASCFSSPDEMASTTRSGPSSARCATSAASRARRGVEDEEADLVLREVDGAVEANAGSLTRQLRRHRARPPLARGTPSGVAAGEDRSRRGSSARLRRYGRRRALERSERLNFALELCAARARCASGRRAWRRCGKGGPPPCARPGTGRRPPRGSSVPPRRGRRHGVRPASAPPRGVRPPIRPSSARAFSAQPAAPSSSKPASAASIASRAGRFCRARRLSTPSASRAARGRRGRRPVRAARTAASRSRIARSTSPRAAATRPRHRVTCASTHARRPARRPPPRRPARRPLRRCGRARATPRRSRRATSAGSARATRPHRPSPRQRRTSPTAAAASPLHSLDHTRQRDKPGEQRAFLVAELAALRRKLRRALELAAMSGDQRHGKEGRADRCPVLLTDLERPLGVLGGDLPAAGPQLDEGQVPERAAAGALVRVPLLLVPGLEERAGPVGADRPREHVTERPARGLQLLAVVAAGGELVGAVCEPRRVLVAAIEAEQGEHGQRAGSKRVVVQLLGEAERGKRVTFRPRQAVDHASRSGQSQGERRLQSGTRSRLENRLREQVDRAVQSLEIGHERKRLGASRPCESLARGARARSPEGAPPRLPRGEHRAAASDAAVTILVRRPRMSPAGRAPRARRRRSARRGRARAPPRRRARPRSRDPDRPRTGRGGARGRRDRRRAAARARWARRRSPAGVRS